MLAPFPPYNLREGKKFISFNCNLKCYPIEIKFIIIIIIIIIVTTISPFGVRMQVYLEKVLCLFALLLLMKLWVIKLRVFEIVITLIRMLHDPRSWDMPQHCVLLDS